LRIEDIQIHPANDTASDIDGRPPLKKTIPETAGTSAGNFSPLPERVAFSYPAVLPVEVTCVKGIPRLINRKITVVGAGAIGGFLCSELACLGAGSGHGELHIIDHDILKPENIGRHFLGMAYVNTYKSKSMESALSKSHPALNIKSTSAQFEESLEQLNGDLIINATGLQTVGVSLEKMLKTMGTHPILHAWIEGQGAGARTLLNDRKGFACFRCLWNPAGDGIYESTIPLLFPNSPIAVTPAGCHQSYFAYPVMAAVKAATLAADAVIDFFNGVQTPRLRNLVIRKDQCLNPEDQNEPKQSDTCPVCL